MSILSLQPCLHFLIGGGDETGDVPDVAAGATGQNRPKTSKCSGSKSSDLLPAKMGQRLNSQTRCLALASRPLVTSSKARSALVAPLLLVAMPFVTSSFGLS